MFRSIPGGLSHFETIFVPKQESFSGTVKNAAKACPCNRNGRERTDGMQMENSFPIRGVIEGYYGKPWTGDQRCDLFTFMRAQGMNSYFYAAKYDAYHRERWQELYRPDDLRELRRVAERAAACGVDFWYCIAPGLTFCYSDEEDMRRLLAKTGQVYELGIRHIGLFLDDIPSELQHARDGERYGSLASAHIDLINRYQALLRQNFAEPITLCVCPWQYCGTGEEEYISELGRGIAPEVRLFWTGPQVCSQTLTGEQAVRFAAATGHPPLYWDNYPVNDSGMYREMHLAPLEGRSADLGAHCDGYVCNGMEYYECTKLVLYTVAAYLRDPAGYQPDVAWEKALTDALGEAGSSFLLFTDHTRRSCLRESNSHNLNAMLQRLRKALILGQGEDAKRELNGYLRQMDQMDTCFAEGKFPQALCDELKPWIRKFDKMHRVLRLTAEYLALPSRVTADWMEDELSAMRAMPVDYGDSVLEQTLGEITRSLVPFGKV